MCLFVCFFFLALLFTNEISTRSKEIALWSSTVNFPHKMWLCLACMHVLFISIAHFIHFFLIYSVAKYARQSKWVSANMIWFVFFFHTALGSRFVSPKMKKKSYFFLLSRRGNIYTLMWKIRIFVSSTGLSTCVCIHCDCIGLSWDSNT